MTSDRTRARQADAENDGSPQDVFVDRDAGVRPWRIHTGPFPLIVAGTPDQLWLWRITNDEHYTAIVVRLNEAVLVSEDELSSSVADAVATRGHSAIKACLGWSEPPRTITFTDPVGRPTYWGGQP